MNHEEVEAMDESPVVEQGTSSVQSMDLGVYDSDKTKVLMGDRYSLPNYPQLPSSKEEEEWIYQMRRTMQEILPGLFLGPYASASRAKLEDMKEAGLTHVVCVRQFLERNLIRANHPDHFKYLIVEIVDSDTEGIIPHFKTVNAFLDDCLSNGGKALVHGSTGNSRSAALVMAYIMSKFGVTLKEASSLVKNKRFSVKVNEGFMAQLREYEPIYRALHTVPIPVPGVDSDRGSMKRKLNLGDAQPSPNARYQFGAAPQANSSSPFQF